MSTQSDLSDIKTAFKEAFTGVAGIAKDLAGAASDKAKSIGRAARLNLDLKAEKDNAAKIYAEIGKLYYETFKDAPGEFFTQLCDEARLAEESIKAMEEELSSLNSTSDAECDCACSFEDAVSAAETEAADESEFVSEFNIPDDPETK